MGKRTTAVHSHFIVLIGVALASLLAGCDAGDGQVRTQGTSESELVAAHSPIVGPVDAPVTIVEFFDPACEGCAAFHPIVKSVLAEFPSEVRLVYRYLPFHKGSDVVVGILEAARKQDKFEVMIDALLSRQSEWASHGRQSLDAAWTIAGEAGLDVTSARIVANSAETLRVIEQDLAAAVTYRIQQTPTAFVNEEMLASYDREELRSRVLRELADRRSPQPTRATP
jgi:protein-disulfide isomerase